MGALNMRDAQAHRGRAMPRRRPVILSIVICVVLALGLGLGLGLGLRRGMSGGHGDAVSPAAPTISSTPIATGWQPAVEASWQIILNRALEINTAAPSVTPNVDIFDIDLFDNPASTIGALHQLGKHVVCYFSAGSYEPNRPDSSKFAKSDLGSELAGWPGEYWLDTKSANVRSIIADRISLAAERKCDAIDPDNVDGYQNSSGLNLTSADSVDYMKFLAIEAGKHNISVGLKNAGDIVEEVLPWIAFSVNEQCAQYGECETFEPFIDAGKPVFHIEYPDGAPNAVNSTKVTEICSGQGRAKGSSKFSTVMKTLDLNGWVKDCDGQTATTLVVTR